MTSRRGGGAMEPLPTHFFACSKNKNLVPLRDHQWSMAGKEIAGCLDPPPGGPASLTPGGEGPKAEALVGTSTRPPAFPSR